MGATEILQRLKSTPAGMNLDWKTVRDEIVAEYDNASTEERVILLGIFHAVMDATERQVSASDLDAFRTARREDHNRMLVSECLAGDGNISADALKAVTEREVAAGRMSPGDELYRVAASGLDAFQPQTPPSSGWRRVFWGRKRE